LNLPNLDWYTLAGYVNYAFNDAWRVSVRGEYLDDKEGLIGATSSGLGPREKIKEATVTFGYSPVKSFELRMEARYDFSDQSSFQEKVNNLLTLVDHQSEIALQGLYKF
jgi:hypothetical protein